MWLNIIELVGPMLMLSYVTWLEVKHNLTNSSEYLEERYLIIGN